jgi:2-methylcitrate dehydratase PrpD
MGSQRDVDGDSAYGVAFLDWLACACAGADQRAPRAVRGSGDDLLTAVAFAGTAGHVLDFDDTLSDGVCHVSATCAPAALVLAAHLGLSTGAMLEAYAEGWEATAAVAAASHPALYDAGWHPTAVCGPVGAAVAAARLLHLGPEARESAVAIAVLRAGGTRGAFGSDGKAIQVGLAAAAGVQAALLARGGAEVDARAIHGALGFEGVLGAGWPSAGNALGAGRPSAAGDALGGIGDHAIDRNWIKLYPSCLGTHAAIEATARAGDEGHQLRGQTWLDVAVDPVARQAAHLDEATDGLSAKFSIQYCVAHTALHGPPGVRDFEAADGATRRFAGRVRVTVDKSLPRFGATLTVAGEEVARVPGPRGAPDRPVTATELAEKVSDLAGDRLDGVLLDLAAPAAVALDAARLRPTETPVSA